MDEATVRAQVEQIRGAMRAEVQRLQQLAETFADARLKQSALRTVADVNDIELFLLRPALNTLTQPHNVPAALWLSGAADWLAAAVHGRERLERYLATYGPDVRTVP